MVIAAILIAPFIVVGVILIAEVRFRRARFKLERDYKIECEMIDKLEEDYLKRRT